MLSRSQEMTEPKRSSGVHLFFEFFFFSFWLRFGFVREEERGREAAAACDEAAEQDATFYCVKASTLPLSNTLMQSSNDARAPRWGAIGEGEGAKGHTGVGDFPFFSFPRTSRRMPRARIEEERQGASFFSLSFLPRIPRSSCDRQGSIINQSPALSRERARSSKERQGVGKKEPEKIPNPEMRRSC